MDLTKSILLLLLFKCYFCQNLENIFRNINDKTGKFNAIAAKIAWESLTNPSNPKLPARAATYQHKRIMWQHQTCGKLSMLYQRHLLNDTEKRQSYLLCRGPKFTFPEIRLTSDLYEELQSIYSDAQVCIPTEVDTSTTNLSNIEEAILNYVSNVRQVFNLERGDFIHFAAKIAVNANTKGKNRLCLKGENDFDKMMAFSRSEEVLRWLWLAWREIVGPPMKEPYTRLANVENEAARRNGYPNIGASWRDELEMPRLRQHCRHLYHNIQHIYRLLHGVVRYYLRRFYGETVPKRGPIPAHLLGNLWSQNWEPLASLMLPKDIDLDSRIKELNWTVNHMAKRAEDFYQSLGLPAMTGTFWRESVFTREKSDARCHGTAADMFQDGDYRLLYCSDTSKEDLYVLHHELGHIEYYMAYEFQPALFRQANTALHETIGDTIMYGVLTPQHLHRLGLINDTLLYTTNDNPDVFINENTLNIENNEPFYKEKHKRYNYFVEHDINKEAHIKKDLEDDVVKENILFEADTNDIYEDKENIDNEKNINNVYEEYNIVFNGEDSVNIAPELFKPEELTTDMILLFRLALNKIPQIPFALVIDEYRWKYFEGGLEEDKENKEFWDLVGELQGVAPVGERGEEYFDVGAKFHVPDNTPYIRYFLSSFLQHQLFEKLCKAAVFGHRNAEGPIPDTISLSRCDIYGSKAAGKILKDLMSRGHSEHWSEILQATINVTEICASALNRYYRPLYHVLDNFVRKYNIPIGW